MTGQANYSAELNETWQSVLLKQGYNDVSTGAWVSSPAPMATGIPNSGCTSYVPGLIRLIRKDGSDPRRRESRTSGEKSAGLNLPTSFTASFLHPLQVRREITGEVEVVEVTFCREGHEDVGRHVQSHFGAIDTQVEDVAPCCPIVGDEVEVTSRDVYPRRELGRPEPNDRSGGVLKLEDRLVGGDIDEVGVGPLLGGDGPRHDVGEGSVDPDGVEGVLRRKGRLEDPDELRQVCRLLDQDRLVMVEEGDGGEGSSHIVGGYVGDPVLLHLVADAVEEDHLPCELIEGRSLCRSPPSP